MHKHHTDEFLNHQPTTYSSVGVGEEFTKLNAVGKKVIVPRSGASTPFLKELLSKIGIDVLEIHLYDVVHLGIQLNGMDLENCFLKIKLMV